MQVYTFQDTSTIIYEINMNGFSGLYPFPEPELYSTLACTILFDMWHCSNIKSIVLRSIRIHFYNIVSLLHGTIQSSIPIQVRSCQNALFNNKMGMCESWTYRHSPHETQRSIQRLLKDCVQSVEEDEFYEEMKDALLQHSQFTTMVLPLYPDWSAEFKSILHHTHTT